MQDTVTFNSSSGLGSNCHLYQSPSPSKITDFWPPSRHDGLDEHLSPESYSFLSHHEPDADCNCRHIRGVTHTLHRQSHHAFGLPAHALTPCNPALCVFSRYHLILLPCLTGFILCAQECGCPAARAPTMQYLCK